ncbi:MAG: HIT family protein [Candidatus Woesearchaeota archaeon]
MAVSEGDLSKLSPEQILRIQKQQCIFCHIVSGQVQSRKVYEDDSVLAILDINPANPGHLLLFPKEHYAILPQIPPEIVYHLMEVSKHLSNALIRAFNVKGTNIFIANGTAAGQKASHFMIHIIPRMPSDGISAFSLEGKGFSEKELEGVQSLIVQKFSELFGRKASEPVNLDKKLVLVGKERGA